MERIAGTLVLNKVNNDIVPNRYEQSTDYQYDKPLAHFQSFKKDMLAPPATTLDTVLNAFNSDTTTFKRAILDACKIKKKAVEADIATGVFSPNVLRVVAVVTNTNIAWIDPTSRTVRFGTKSLKEPLPCSTIVGPAAGGGFAVTINVPPLRLVDEVVRCRFATEQDLEVLPAAWLKEFSNDRKKKKCEIVRDILDGTYQAA